MKWKGAFSSSAPESIKHVKVAHHHRAKSRQNKRQNILAFVQRRGNATGVGLAPNALNTQRDLGQPDVDSWQCPYVVVIETAEMLRWLGRDKEI